MNTTLLDKLDINNLEKIKIEAELNLDELSNSEEIITNKSNTLFQVLVVIVSSLIGYLISQIDCFNIYSLLIQISIFWILVIGYVLFILIKIIYPNKIALKGASPENLLQNFIFQNKSHDEDTRNLLRNRVYSLNIAIQNNKDNLKQRVILFDKANKTILVGLIVIIIYSIAFFCS